MKRSHGDGRVHVGTLSLVSLLLRSGGSHAALGPSHRETSLGHGRTAPWSL